jgi:hypothetical protein
VIDEADLDEDGGQIDMRCNELLHCVSCAPLS